MKPRMFVLALIMLVPATIAGDLPGREKRLLTSDGLPEGLDGGVEAVVAQVSDSSITEIVSSLVEFQTRYSCTDSNAAAAQWIHDKFLEFGYTDVSFDSFPFDEPDFPCDLQRNVVAVKPGAIDPDRVLIVGAHYDSYVNPTEPCDPDSFAPGADDNASGTTATLEVARVLADEMTDVTLIFIAFAAEEEGLLGSFHYAEEVFEAGMDIRLMTNLDVISYPHDEVWDIRIMVDSTAVPFAEIAAEVAVQYTDLIPEIDAVANPGFWQFADGSPFYDLGYSVMVAMEPFISPHIHHCTDVVENISIPYLTDVTEMVAASILIFSRMPEAPSGFNAVNTGDGTSLYLSWDPNEEADLAGYRIYWGTQPAVYDSVRTVMTTGDTLENLVEGETYYFALSAFDTGDYESFLTEEVEITASSRPATPTGVTSISLSNEILLTWDPNQSELDLAGYRVYRWREDEPSDTVMVAFVPDPTTTFSDNSAEPHILYGYHLTAVDTQHPPSESNPSAAVFGRLATHDMGLLVVDNTADGYGGPFAPTDEAVDDFYARILEGYHISASWDVKDSLAAGRSLMDYDTGIYSTVVWHTDIRGAAPAVTDTTTMRKYLVGDGNLWLSGWKILAFLTGRGEAYYIFGEDGFVPHYVGIDSAKTTAVGDQDFIGAESLVEDFPSVQVDPGKVFPIGALYDMEILLPPFEGTYPVYSYTSSDSAASEYHGLPVAVADSSAGYDFVMTDFPLYFMDEVGARLLARAAMELLGEPVSIAGVEIVATLPRVYALSQNYPNPFNPMTTIGYAIPGYAGSEVRVKIRIFDVRGRLIKTLVDGLEGPGAYHVVWDGRDDRGDRVGSGIYLYKIEAGDYSATRKMTLVR